MCRVLALLLCFTKGETIETLLLHMKKPVDGLMDERAPYVALSRATALEKLYMVEPINIDQLRHKPKEDIAATLDFLDRLDKATQAAFLDNPSVFTPVTVRSLAKDYDRRKEGARGGSGDESDDRGDGVGGIGSGGAGTQPPVPLVTFLAPNSRNNCFFNASVASTLAAYDGQPLLPGESSTPAARKFFSAVDAVRENMHSDALPHEVLVGSSFFACMLSIL